MKRRRIAVLGLSAMLADAPAVAQDMVVERATIIAVSGTPRFLFGALATFIRLSGRRADGDKDYLIPYLSEDQTLLMAGAKCIITYAVTDAEGYVGPEMEPVRGGRWVEDLRCGAIEWSVQD